MALKNLFLNLFVKESKTYLLESDIIKDKLYYIYLRFQKLNLRKTRAIFCLTR